MPLGMLPGTARRTPRTLLSVGRLTAAFLLLSGPASAQDAPARWERRLEASQPRLTVFHAPVAIHLPTAETLSRGEWQFEISHRFFPPLSDGADALWGLDGPVNLRIGLGYAVTDRTLVTAARSNVQDNWDLQVKVRAAEGEVGSVPFLAAVLGGAGWSTDVGDREATDAGNFQFYGQLILNARVGEWLALGVVPSYLHNVLLDADNMEGDVFLGTNARFRLSEIASLEGEWILSQAREDAGHDLAAIGLELETGGHFFKVFLTNSVRLNPGQYLPGSDFAFQPDEWRLGFTITRLLRF